MNRRRMLLSSGGISLPEGYTAIEYLESDGNHFIDTGYKAKWNTKVSMDLSDIGEGPYFFFGARNTSSATATKQFSLYRSSATNIRCDYFGNTVSLYISDLTSRGIFSRDANVVNVYNLTATNTAVTSGECEQNLYLFALNDIGEAILCMPCRIYSCQIYDNGTLVRNFIPAMNASGDAGLYDLKNDVWYALKPAYGCYIQDTTGKLWTSAAWNGSATPNGVAVLTDACKFVIALSEPGSNIPIDTTGAFSSMTLPVYDSSSDAITDYSGSSNTTAMVSAYGNGTGEAAGYCANFTFPNGKKGYLGSAGEWQVAYDNMPAVEACMSAAGGSELGSTYYWSSTRASNQTGLYYRSWRMRWDTGSWSRSKVTIESRTRPFCAL